MSRASRPCPTPGCPNLSPCAQHPGRKPWTDANGANRRHRLPPDWKQRRRAVLERDRGICHVCRQPGADEVDHLIPNARGGTDDPSNLAAIHSKPCHERKSAAERAEGRRRNRQR